VKGAWNRSKGIGGRWGSGQGLSNKLGGKKASRFERGGRGEMKRKKKRRLGGFGVEVEKGKKGRGYNQHLNGKTKKEKKSGSVTRRCENQWRKAFLATKKEKGQKMSKI